MAKSDQINTPPIGDLIRSLLKKNSLSMRNLATLCGIDSATISRILNGKQQPKLTHLKLFSEHLDISMDQLIKAAGFEGYGGKRERNAGIHDSLDEIMEILRESRLFDPEATTARIKQELVKYEQYAQTDEGHNLICNEFHLKVGQVGVGPFIEHLKTMHIRYCGEDTPDREKLLLGSALLYFILSADIIPDYLFPIGYLDDAIAVQLVLNRLNEEEFTA
ncbi:DUF1232 domain-containing protein [Gorillibacterium massiliense]|uniref:DUF1232 domain-containing protein n=1 Tax=Gorillibacterium massiliense TaxID=1280390 RepID=UPI0004AF6C04|nr:DUF1232 domain-containing protein [Gorillibacterium massiliense]